MQFVHVKLEALSDKRTGLSFVSVNIISNKSVVTTYVIFTFYVLSHDSNICIYTVGIKRLTLQIEDISYRK
jgi:hypothetical protein